MQNDRERQCRLEAARSQGWAHRTNTLAYMGEMQTACRRLRFPWLGFAMTARSKATVISGASLKLELCPGYARLPAWVRARGKRRKRCRRRQPLYCDRRNGKPA